MKTQITALLLLLATFCSAQKNTASLDITMGINHSMPGQLGSQRGASFLITRDNPVKEFDLSYGVTINHYEYNNPELSKDFLLLFNAGVEGGGDRFLLGVGTIGGHRLPLAVGFNWRKYFKLDNHIAFVLSTRIIQTQWTLIDFGFGISLR